MTFAVARTSSALVSGSAARNGPSSSRLLLLPATASSGSNFTRSYHSSQPVQVAAQQQQLKRPRQHCSNTLSRCQYGYNSSLTTSRLAPLRTLATISNSQTSSNEPAQALIIGAGPAGLAAAGVLTDLGLSSRSLAWVDPVFNGGRVQEKYREVPSNTKVHTFLDYARACQVFQEIEKEASVSGPHGIKALAELDQEKTCELGKAVDMAQVLIGGLSEREGVKKVVGRVVAADWTSEGVWNVTLDSGETIRAERIVLATGSEPRPSITPPGTNLIPLNLDDVLHPSTLHKVLPDPQSARVAVVGASHSAVLAIRNLYNAGVSHLTNFSRSELKYAVYKKDYILYDNTGLKGLAADWAREYLEEDGPNRDRSKITRVHLPGPDAQQPSEEEIYAQHLPGCTHILHAWGFAPRSLPRITASGIKDVDVSKGIEFDNETGRFFWKDSSVSGSKAYVPRLFGCGIAFPQRVTDPEGNVELAVGFWKFIKFLRSVGPTWASS